MKKLFVAALLIAALFGNTKKELVYTTDTHIVTRGETLWSISKEYKPANMDLREYIDRVEKFNGITANIQEGQEIQMLVIENVD